MLQKNRTEMACFERASPALKEILLKIHRSDGPLEMDHQIHEFGDVHYRIQCSASNPLNTCLSVSTPLMSRGSQLSPMLQHHFREMAKKISPDVIEIVEPPREGYQLTLKLNFAKLPRCKASTKKITEISSVQAVILSTHFKEILKNADLRLPFQGMSLPIKLIYHPREPFFVIKEPEKITAIYPLRFKEQADVIIATTFFQELVDVRNSRVYDQVPHCTWSPIPPPGLRGEPIEDLSTNCGFVSFDITSHHIRGKKLDKTVWNLLNFITFAKYHVKSTKNFIQRRMRMRLDSFVQLLHDAEIEENQKTIKKTSRGYRCMPKWIGSSKSKIILKKHVFASKIKRIKSKIKRYGYKHFRRPWLKLPNFFPVARYTRLE